MKRTEEMFLAEALRDYAENGRYPMHMPGHKRNIDRYEMINPYALDITEIDGFDDLHEPEGILCRGMERAARVCGAEESWYLVGGSTVGILAAIGACVRPGERILVARNCHKSVYHAMELYHLEPIYVYPKPVTQHPAAAFNGEEPICRTAEAGPGRRTAKAGSGRPTAGGEQISSTAGGESVRRHGLVTGEKDADCEFCWPIDGSIPPEAVGRALAEGSFGLVVITSPTYEGVISDVASIAAICHRSGVPLLVDEAHGAHLEVTGGRTFCHMEAPEEVTGGYTFCRLEAPEDAAAAADLLGCQVLEEVGIPTQKEVDFPSGALSCGADLVVQSLHKTLPAFTQTALLHRQGDLVSGSRVKHFLDILQTSSPSYILMAGLDRCIGILEQERTRAEGAFPEWRLALAKFYRSCGDLQLLRVLGAKSGTDTAPERGAGGVSGSGTGGVSGSGTGGVSGSGTKDTSGSGTKDTSGSGTGDISESGTDGIFYYERNGFFDRDPSKLVISAGRSGHTGGELMDALRKEGFELEMASTDYVIAMTGAGDRWEMLDEFAAALHRIDARWASERRENAEAGGKQLSQEAAVPGPAGPPEGESLPTLRAESVLPLWETAGMEGEYLLWEEAKGRISEEFLYAYPPGIPVLAPGERITEAVLAALQQCRRTGVALRGAERAGEGMIRVVRVEPCCKR